MINTSIGDLSQSYFLRERNASLKVDMARFTNELTTGQVSNIRDVLGGNHSQLADYERRMNLLSSYKIATTEAAQFSQTVQNALEVVTDHSDRLSNSLIIAGTSAIGPSGTDTASEARNSLDGMIAAINTKVAGRFSFAGAATGTMPLTGAETLLTGLSAAMAGATTVDDMIIAATTWFDDPIGFDALVYQASDQSLSDFKLSEQESVKLDVKATDPGLKDVLKLTALAALADDPAFGLGVAEQSDLFAQTGEKLRGAHGRVIALQANVGFAESRIEGITARNAAERTSLEYAQNALLAVDPFEAATRLEEVQFQLQSLYSVTVRMSQLSLVNFL